MSVARSPGTYTQGVFPSVAKLKIRGRAFELECGSLISNARNIKSDMNLTNKIIWTYVRLPASARFHEVDVLGRML